MEMNEIIALLIVGALAGSAASSLFRLGKSKSTVNTWLRNILVGVVGAIVGGFIFNQLDIELSGLLETSITLADLLVAFVGALVVLLVANLIAKR